ncbi:MAG: lipopolysaccharide heptosyltransferase II [Nitrospirae bacterium]|nr:lipopolysaccharide heptosyltransferase II [Nitrospirota bacterium]
MTTRDEPRRLLVRVPNWVGDVVHSLPAVAALRARFPRAELTVLARGEAGTILHHHPAVDRVVGYRAGRGWAQLGRLRETAGRLRGESYDMGILLPNSFESAWLFWWAGIPRRYGFATDGRGWLLTEPQPCTAGVRTLHQADYYLALLAGLGVAGSRSWQRLESTAEERNGAAERLAGAGWSPGDSPLIALCPGAGYGSAKRWPLERYGELTRRLSREYGATTVILGGPAERAMGEALAAQGGRRVIDLTGRTSLREALAVLSCAAVVVSNDSGLLHVAAAAGRPVVGLFGPTNPDRTGPTGADASSVTIVRRPVNCSPCELRECPIDHRCMVWLEPDEVCAAVHRHLTASSPVRGVGTSEHAASIPHGPPRAVRPVVFLDRDGTLNRDVGYLSNPEQLELFPGVGAALRALKEAGAQTIIVTNQSGIARGVLTEATLRLIHERLSALLRAEGASVDAVFYCPHHPDDGCRCRKPETELIDRAKRQLGLALDHAYVVGDKLADARLAHRIGAKSVLVRTGHGEQVLKEWPDGERPPDHVANDLPAAAQWIIGQQQPAAAGSAGGAGATPPQGTPWGNQAIDAVPIPHGPPHTITGPGRSRS